jgi:hypothetical protein
MSLFHSILSGLQDTFNKETAQTEELAASISGILGTTITKEQLVVKKNTLYIKVPSTLKMAIALNKEKLLIKVKEINSSITVIV